MYSLWVEVLYCFLLVQYLWDCVFWLLYNMDFCGCIYFCLLYFNYLGSDVVWVLLEFVQGCLFGLYGLDWFKIYLVNFMGLKKWELLWKCLVFVEEVMDDILDFVD